MLIHPEFLRDRSSTSILSRLRGAGQRVAAFGWAQLGPMRDLIESANLVRVRVHAPVMPLCPACRTNRPRPCPLH